MHHPPAVTFPVPVSRWGYRLMVAGGLLTGLQSAIFFSRNAWTGWQAPVVAIALILAFGLLLFYQRRPATGDLQWTGEAWQWSAFPAMSVCTLRLHLDFQSVMLVSVRYPSGAPAWLWLERSQVPQQWLAVRRAVVHTASAPALQAHRADAVSPVSSP